ncbi:MAG: mannose-1-phosphate guanylyltransferase [Flavobacteriales bacterium]|jgi:mannose-1-phosphate guanylyltransferase|nr:mannose-1-phosphate guanylyltransferase [Flavobacteriales bacterium]
MENNYLVVMAGGIGSRFWPMSKESFPKQFHDVLGVGKSLLQLTVERFKNTCPKENIYIVTNEAYLDLVKEQLPFLEDSQILLEPFRKNTAPCVAYASYKIKSINENAKLIIVPSDHVILNQIEFESTLQIALKEADNQQLITLGIHPSRPDTGYGYIQFEDFSDDKPKSLKRVKTFTEKPPLDLAIKFLESGEFYWNSGMFIWSADSIINAFEKHMPDLHKVFHDALPIFNTNQEASLIKSIYPVCKNISIDNGIMEQASNVLVVLADFGWSDLGTWGSLYENLPKDESKNAVVGEKITLYNSSNNIIRMPKNKLALIEGLEGYIVVENENTLLICKKENEQTIKSYVQDLKAKFKNEDI